jgi:hypothetical protein
MKKWLYLFFFAACCLSTLEAQNRSGRQAGGRQERGGFSLAARNATQLPDSLLAPDTAAVPTERISAYRLTELGDRYLVPMDTDRLNMANNTFVDGRNLAVAYTGNIGSATQSRIFTERRESRDFIFAEPYDAHIVNAQNARFYDTRIPYTNIRYTRAGSSDRMEEELNMLLTSNFGKQINVGGDFEYIYSRGFYNSNGNKLINYRLFGNYRSDRYEAFAHVHNFNMVTSENGGLTNDRYVTHPDDFADGKRQVDTKSYPTRFSDTWNRVRGKNFFLAHRYNLGFYREMTARESANKQQKAEEKQQRLAEQTLDSEDPGDPTPPPAVEEPDDDPHANEVFIPVSSLIHTVEYEDNRRRFISEHPAIDTCYTNIYGRPNELPNDTAAAWRLRNTLALSMREGFQDWVKFGLSLFAGIENRGFNYPGDTIGDARHAGEFSSFIGGEISKQQGRILTYNAYGELCIAGDDIGEFRLRGNVRTRFPLLRGRDASLEINGFIRNVRPAFFHRHYAGRYFAWEQNLNMTQHLHLEGAAAIETTRTRLAAGVESIQGHVYFASDGIPHQYAGNIQVVTARLRQDLHYRALGWDNELVYQLSSEKTALPLPLLCAYTNLYAAFRLFGVLTVQLGGDMHYYTAYHSPTYEPSTQQFINQEQLKTGNYPLVNAYANFHLKQTRFFITAYNLGSLFIDHPAYFSMPHYPLNPMTVKIGLAVMFNN